jgi:1-acyl-sn-glycerol-3-phosphate acyltransferase
MLKKLVGELLHVPRVEESIDSLAIAQGDLGYDPWGFNPGKSKLIGSLAYRFYQYFRPVVHGLEHLPPGRMLVVPNHSGQLPFDGMIVSLACLMEARPPRFLRSMVERWFPTLPYIGTIFNRAGAVLGDPINCRNLLEADNAILVFPEGVRGSGKTWEHRYHLQPFGRGFMRLALQTNSPIVPVAVIGGEESMISLYDFKPLARLLGTPYFPIPPHLPLLGLLAYWPLPVQFHLYFGQPLTFSGPFDDEDEAIDAKVAVVHQRVQEMIDEGLARRTSVFGMRTAAKQQGRFGSCKDVLP